MCQMGLLNMDGCRNLLIRIIHCLGSCMVDDRLLMLRWHRLLHVLRGLWLVWDLGLGWRDVGGLWDKGTAWWR